MDTEIWYALTKEPYIIKHVLPGWGRFIGGETEKLSMSKRKYCPAYGSVLEDIPIFQS